MTQKYNRQRQWTKEEIATIIELYKFVGPKKLTDVICRTWRAIERKAGELDLRRTTPRWTASEIKKLSIGREIKRSQTAQNIKRSREKMPLKKRGRKPKHNCQ